MHLCNIGTVLLITIYELLLCFIISDSNSCSCDNWISLFIDLVLYLDIILGVHNLLIFTNIVIIMIVVICTQ